MQTGTISVQSENIFPIIKKFLYSEQEIFLRELISNAVDATSKLKTLASKGEFKGEMGDLTINVDVDKEDWEFHVGDNVASRAGDVMWFGPLKPIQKLFFHTPLVYMFVFGSYFYHDFIHWPFIGSPIYKKWLSESKWGKLFGEY